jgi:hypothetical protein
MLDKLITNRQLGQFVAEHRPETIIEGGYVSYLIRDGQDIVVSWDYGNVFSCKLYFPTTSEDYEKLLALAEKWNSVHGDWRLVETFARFRLEQIKRALDGSQRLAVTG